MPVGICYCTELGTLNADGGAGKRFVLMIRNCSCQYNISLLSMTSKGGKGDKKEMITAFILAFYHMYSNVSGDKDRYYE